MLPNVLWYICLAVIGVVAACFTIYKKKNIATLIVFYLFAIGITFLGEFLVLAVFRAYVYKPGLLADPTGDAMVGHVILNTTLWPGIGILIAAFSLRFLWLFLITAFFVLAEYLFIKLGIFEHHWWELYMSALVTFAYCVVAKKWFRKLNQNLLRYPRCLTFYFAGTIIINLPIIFLLFIGKQRYSIGWDKNLYLDSGLFAFIYDSVLGLVSVFFICILKKKLLWKLAPIPIILLCNIILLKMNILIFENGWSLLYLTAVNIASLAVYILLEKYSLKKPLVLE